MKTKKPYLKPTLTKVDLRPEEAVLTACKHTDFSGGRSNRCGWSSRCRWTMGS